MACFNRKEMHLFLAKARESHEGDQLLSVLTFNVLARMSADARSVEILDEIYTAENAEVVRDWPYRVAIMKKHLIDSNADVIFLQECEKWAFEQDFSPALTGAGYDGLVEDRIKKKSKMNGGNALPLPGCALFFKRELFELAWREFPFRSLLCGLRFRCGPLCGKIMAFANSHLEGAPWKVDERRNQIDSVLRRMHKNKFSYVILGGDYNDGDAEGSALNRTYLPHLGFENSYTNSPARARTCVCGKLALSAAEIEGMRDSFRVDHIYFKRDQADLVGVMNVIDPDQDIEKLFEKGLPNREWPSDHFSIAAVVKLRPDVEEFRGKANQGPKGPEISVEVLMKEPKLSSAEQKTWEELRSRKAKNREEGLELLNARKAFLQSLTEEGKKFALLLEHSVKAEGKMQKRKT